MSMPQFVNIHDAKTNPSKYLEQIVKNHEVIVICRSGKPLAQLTEYVTHRHRKLGLLKNKIKINKDFDKTSDDFKEDSIYFS